MLRGFSIATCIHLADLFPRTDQVTIGKYKEDHPCNPQSLRILAGDDPSHLEEVLDINLKNDSTPETADLRHNALVWKGDMAAGNLWDLGKERSVIVSMGGERSNNRLTASPISHLR